MPDYHFSSQRRSLLLAIAALSLSSVPGAETLYQEGFNNDGEAANPKRYTTTGRDVFEIDRRAELLDANQLGPVYWAHNTEVSFAGVPAPTGARRMIMAWDQAITEDATSADMLALFDSSIKWLLNNKAGARIIISPAGASLGVLSDRLTAAGYTLVDDDAAVSEEQVQTQGDLLIHAIGAPGSRGAQAPIPLLSIVSTDHDDVLVSSIGTATAFAPGKGTITAPTHPAAGGKTGEFDVANASFTWQLIGTQLPGNATVLATFTQEVPPSVTSIADVDAMIAGTKQSTAATEQIAVLDFSDGSVGNWTDDLAVPGGAIGNWGLYATGKVNVTAAGTYSFALGTDDGGRVQIDANKNGFDATDTIITDAGPHAHTLAFGNATFSAAGSYDIRVVGFNSGGGGGLEVSVAITAGAGQVDLAAAPENWEVLGITGGISPVKADGTFAVTSYVATGEVVQQVHPLIVLLNGPNDTPPGSVFGGGPFTGFEGTGFFGGAGMNKWAPPDTGDRTLLLAPINVAGKQNVKLTMAVAGTFLDFEPSAGTRGSPDYLEVVIDTDGAGPKDFERLIYFTSPSAADKFMDDRATSPQNPTRMVLGFKDITYAIPAGATDLVIELRGYTSWWNEIIAFDNIRVTADSTGTGGDPTLSIAQEGANAVVTFANGTLQRATALTSNTQWQDVVTTGNTFTIAPAQQGLREFFRVRK